MNERLQQLAREAGHFEFNKWDYFDIDKFAELIVKECARSLWTEECHTSDLAVEEFNRNSEKIKKHFGVEE